MRGSREPGSTLLAEFSRRAWLYHAALLACLLGALILADIAIVGRQQGRSILALDGRAAAFSLEHVHELELDGTTPYRWTIGTARLHFDAPPGGRPLALNLALGARPPGLDPSTFQLAAGDRILGTFALGEQPRMYHLLVPQRHFWQPDFVVRLDSATVAVPPDTRQVGVRLEAAGLTVLGSGPRWPSPALLLAQALLLAAILAICIQIRTRNVVRAGALAGTTLLLAGLVAFQAPVVIAYTVRLAVAAVILACLTRLLVPIAERAASAFGVADRGLIGSLWAVTLLAIAIRLAGALYPLYSAHDLPLNVERLVRTIGGTLVSTNRSFEFRSGVTVYPPGPYLALLPAFLPGLSAGLLVQAGNAVVDGLSALATGLLALKLGADRRSALLAAFLYAGLPVMLTSLYWGHSAQIFGQALMAPLAITLLVGFERPRVRTWAIASALLAAAFLSHIGVTVIAIAWLGVVWLLVRVRSTLAWRPWWHLTMALGTAGIAGLMLVYGPALALKAEQTAQVGERVLHESYSSQILISRAAVISFYLYGWPLVLAGLAFLPRIWSRTRGGADLLVAWIVVALLFCAIELATGLQARYFVFLAPVACLCMALPLDWLAGRGRVWAVAAWIIALLLVVQGCAAWYNGVFNDVQMSMVPLLR